MESSYDLDKTLDKYPVKELNDPEMKVRVMESLEKGNLEEVTFDLKRMASKKRCSSNHCP